MAPQVQTPAGARIRKKTKNQNKEGGGVLFVLQEPNTGEYQIVLPQEYKTVL